MAEKLSWHKARGVWKKQFRGRVFYIPVSVKGKSDREGRRRAESWWRQKRADLERESAPNSSAEIASQNPSPGMVFMLTAPQLQHLQNLSPNQPTPGEKSISALIEKYLAEARHQAEIKKRSPATYREHGFHLAWFENVFLGEDWQQITGKPIPTEIHQLDESLIALVKQHCELKVADEEIVPQTARKRLMFVRRFLEFCYRNNHLDRLPRNLDKNFSKVDIPAPSTEEKIYEVDEVRKLFANASQRTKLYIALAVNFGWLPSDIGTFSHEMIDWENGIVTRLRHKTKRTGSVQTSFKIWEVTAELLKAEMTDPEKSDFVLLAANGKPLYSDRIKGLRNPIRDAFDRARRKAFGSEQVPKRNGKAVSRWKKPADSRSFKSFRKTSATLIEKLYQDQPRIADLFLGHSEKNTIRQNYVVRQFDLVYQACSELDSIYQLGNLL